jgi:hypothetical protein
MARGRTKIYASAAEKQKAYRDRQKASVTKLTALEHWQQENERYQRLWSDLHARYKTTPDYEAWVAERKYLHTAAIEVWWYMRCLESHEIGSWASSEAKEHGEPIALRLIEEWAVAHG